MDRGIAEPGAETRAAIFLVGDPRERWLAGHSSHRRFGPFAALLAVAMMAHIIPIAGLLTMPAYVGSPNGMPDGVIVEIIDAVELSPRISPARPEPAEELQPQPARQPAAEAEAPRKTAKAESVRTTARPEPGLTRGDLAEALATPITSGLPPTSRSLDLDARMPPIGTVPQRRAAGPPVSDLERYLERRNRSPQSRGAEIDDFTRTIATSVERAKPQSPDLGGRVVVEFIVGATGQMEDLRLVESSGSPRLDDLVMRAVRRVQLVVPPPTATSRDRTFEITFSYR